MSEHNVSATPATPMNVVKQIYELFQDPTRFIIGGWAQDREHHFVKANNKTACCWSLSGAVLRNYNLNADIAYKYADYKSPNNLSDTFKLLWEKLPANSKMSVTSSWDYIDDIAQFNDKFGYTGVMRLLQAVIDDTEYMQEA